MRTLDTYLVSLQRQGLLLPKAIVAEVIPYEPLQRIEESPDWFLGLLRWRGIQVPVLSFEMLSVRRATFALVSVASASLVILRGADDPESLPYYAMVAQTQPRSVELTEGMLFDLGDEVENTESARVRFEDQLVSIPDLDYIESAIQKVLAETATV